jgi:hypothetical protein
MWGGCWGWNDIKELGGYKKEKKLKKKKELFGVCFAYSSIWRDHWG